MKYCECNAVAFDLVARKPSRAAKISSAADNIGESLHTVACFTQQSACLERVVFFVSRQATEV